MDFDNPNLDMQGIAAGFGARIEKIDKLGTIGEVIAGRTASAFEVKLFVILAATPTHSAHFRIRWQLVANKLVYVHERCLDRLKLAVVLKRDRQSRATPSAGRP